MSDKFTPIVTNYKGIKFRSKSEAIFARALDIAADDYGSVVWEYEPEAYRHGNYVPDFLVAAGFTEGIELWLIEYKPSEPSEAYLASWEEKARFYESIKQPIKVRCFLAFGSPYSAKYGQYAIFGGDVKTKDCWPLGLNVFAEEARSYRYDLAESAA